MQLTILNSNLLKVTQILRPLEFFYYFLKISFFDQILFSIHFLDSFLNGFINQKHL